MNETLILVATFTAVLLAVFSVMSVILGRRDVQRNLDSARRRRKTSDDIDALLGSGNEDLRYYLDVVRNESPDSIRMRLVQAGYFSKSAVRIFSVIRLIAVLAVFFLVQFVLPQVVPDAPTTAVHVFSAIGGGLTFILCGIFLERMGLKRMREYRKLFPDLMDLLLVCIDAGLSIDSALDRVTREFLQTVPDFGIQLSIINLEIRAGRSLDEALSSFSERVRVDEARTLAVLFRQSKELGADVSRTLRSFAHEMRQMRLVRAEEKANSLPIKMLFPMAFFMFPVSLIIVLVPIMMTIIKLFIQLSPG
ncbi:type II secretion system F family protein [Alisedimentitalea sp. MJ-SS2]|uniref:type II secretion system F family protein n=1 Tax=Aliisedimentitalea sp. MJ-SS2 TaxID=3049795 RepID=UPI002914C136|nr:type II secretion system F family protein [Alisedimentitalea sp. MJ-SS2]MDU8928269.1 type II secretion system F family protein [Alisedimentitalea sp. MJ-SS2]